MEIAYTAHTETCTLLLDAGGICRSVLAASSRVAVNAGATRIPTSAEKCVGAQYVATLDLTAPGGMTAMPKPGAQMLFARTEANGRITLVRSAPVIRFEATPAGVDRAALRAEAASIVDRAAPRADSPAKRGESGVHSRGDSRATIHEDEELTLPCDPPTLNRRSSAPPPPRALPPRPEPQRAVPPRPQTQYSSVRPEAELISAEPPRRYSAPPRPEPRNSSVVPAGAVRRTPIPPPPRPARVESAPGSLTRPTYPAPTPPPPSTPMSGVRTPTPSTPLKRPSIARITATSASDWSDYGDVATRPYRRASR